MFFFKFFFKLINLLIFYFMAVLGLCFCTRALSSCGKWGPLFITVRGPPTIAASLVAEHRLQTRSLSNCGSRAQLLHSTWDPPRPGLEPACPAPAGRLPTTAPPGKPPKWLLNLEAHGRCLSSVFTQSSNCARLWLEQSPSLVLMFTCTCFMIWTIFPQTPYTSVSTSEKWAEYSTPLTGWQWGVKWRGLRHGEYFIHMVSPPPQGTAFFNDSNIPISGTGHISTVKRGGHIDPFPWLFVTVSFHFVIRTSQRSWCAQIHHAFIPTTPDI